MAHRDDRKRRRVVVDLQKELENWLQNSNPQDAIRVISGGPGSGKSSFARIFAAHLSDHSKIKVLYIPLHLIDPSKDLIEEIGRFVRDEGVLIQNPLGPDSLEPNLLIIFDGLDELASQGKAAAQTAQAFVREVDRTVERRNIKSVKLHVLISGRELVVQENESEFRRPRQILNLLPYYIPQSSGSERHLIREGEEYHDPDELLKSDLRQQWWKNYGALTGKEYKGLPKELSREDLSEITAQPLLNYLVALSFSRKKIDFSRDINLNAIYEDLVAAVHERGYEKHRAHISIRHIKYEDFFRILEEIGLAAWHGDGRTTTVREIEEHCLQSGLGSLLNAFQDGAKAGVTRLLAAFFFRQYGQRSSGDPTFVFTHKSFGEYLAARRVTRTIKRVVQELENRVKSPDSGWDEKEALKHWTQICGPCAISQYMYNFLLNEIRRQKPEELPQWQTRLAKLFSYMLRYATPMEQIPLKSFKEALLQSRNSEEALLVTLNSCARVIQKVSEIEQPDPFSFGVWFKRIQGQRKGSESVLAANCLSFLDLSGAIIDIGDYYHTVFNNSVLKGLRATLSCFQNSSLINADLEGANLPRANLRGANLQGANLVGANLQGANLQGANLERANLEGANLERADLDGANLRGANLEGANLNGANLEEANLQGAHLEGAHLWKANLKGANLEGANLERAHLEGAILPEKYQKTLRSEKSTQ